MRPRGDNRARRGPFRVSLIIAPSAPDQDWSRGLDQYRATLSIRPEIASVDVIFADAASEFGGLEGARGDYCVVVDPDRGYAPEAVIAVLEPLFEGKADLAVATERRRGPFWSPSAWLNRGLGWASRLMLGTSDVFSGLFAMNRLTWQEAFQRSPDARPGSILGVALGRRTRETDVPAASHESFETRGLDLADLRPLKRLLDGRHGNLSRFVQFCMVGASGMVVDLSTYALLQWVFSRTVLATRSSSFFAVPWSLVVASALSIAMALVWNFSLNRRLTFNDARGSPIIRQFLTYVLSNALAVALSFTVRLYLPSRVAFFARHRLAAAVVGIVAATGLSFSMSRWVVFSKTPDRSQSKPRTQESSPIEPTSVVV